MTHNETILVVDDNADNLDLLEKRFRSMGYNVATARDGEEALERVAQLSPDLVILDVMMPRMDGFEACHRLKSDPATRRIPVILLTARKEVPDKVKGFHTGADDYVTKPFNPRELVARVEALLDRRSSEQRQATAEKLGALGLMAEGVAHEVRNPMVTIGGFARRILKTAPPDSQVHEYAGHIVKEVERLEQMVDAILRYKNIVVRPYDPVDVGAAARAVLEESELDCKRLGVTAEVRIPAEPLEVEGDEENLKLALRHLVRNALDAMDEKGGRLTVSAGRSPRDFEKVQVEIADTGRGIPKADLPHVFDPFFTSKVEGAGIGLTMVHHIVTRHGGEVSLTSQEGEGTRVTVVLPVRQERVR
jgi:two-component system sensor histidine kinase/response regulator